MGRGGLGRGLRAKETRKDLYAAMRADFPGELRTRSSWSNINVMRSRRLVCRRTPLRNADTRSSSVSNTTGLRTSTPARSGSPEMTHRICRSRLCRSPCRFCNPRRRTRPAFNSCREPALPGCRPTGADSSGAAWDADEFPSRPGRAGPPWPQSGDAVGEIGLADVVDGSRADPQIDRNGSLGASGTAHQDDRRVPLLRSA